MTALLIILTGLLVFVNAFFVIAEYAVVRSRRTRLEQLVEEGSRSAALAVAQIDQMGDYIAACQVGITMASIGIGALGEPAVAHLLEPIFGGHAIEVAVAVSAAVAYVLITFILSTVGEIVPKLYTIQHAEGLLRRVAPAMRFFMFVFRPFIFALNVTSETILRRVLGTDPAAAPEAGTAEELKRIIAESQTGGHLDVGEAEMLTGVFHLHEQDARQVMTPIPAVVTVGVEDTVSDALRQAIATGHSRLVVIEDEDQDRVCGIVHVNQLIKEMLDNGSDTGFANRVRVAPIVPETKPLDDLLADLQRERTEMAIVVDEYGRTAGIVTIEDIIEEVVGEITDETDPAGGSVRQLATGDWFVRGHVAISDLENYGLELPVDTDAYNSVGGLVFAALGRLPKRGDTIQVNGYQIRVESVRQNRIEAVRIRHRPDRAVAGPEPTQDD